MHEDLKTWDFLGSWFKNIKKFGGGYLWCGAKMKTEEKEEKQNLPKGETKNGYEQEDV